MMKKRIWFKNMERYVYFTDKDVKKGGWVKAGLGDVRVTAFPIEQYMSEKNGVEVWSSPLRL